MKNSKKVAKVKKVLSKMYLAALTLSIMFRGSLVAAFAADKKTATPEEKWDSIIGFILPWITRLGGVVILIGAVEFGLAFKDQDAEGKTRGMRTAIAGLIVTAVSASSSLFLS